MNRKELFESLGKDLGKLVGKKDEHYGEMMNSTAQYLTSVFPNGITVEQYGIVGLHVRIFDKLRRSTNGTHDNAEDWRDIAGYGLQGLSHYTDIIEQRIIADEQIEAEHRETHEKLVERAFIVAGQFCTNYCKCEDCQLGKEKFKREISCPDFLKQHPQLALDLMTNN